MNADHYDFRPDRIFAAGLTLSKKPSGTTIATRKPIVRILVAVLGVVSIGMTWILIPYLKDHAEAIWIIIGLWAITAVCGVLFAFPHDVIRLFPGDNRLELCRGYFGVFMRKQNIPFASIQKIEKAKFVQLAYEKDREELSEKAAMQAMGLILPIRLVRTGTYEEDVFAICLELNSGEKIVTHFTWDETSVTRALDALHGATK